jgi:hypothetical protein
LTYFMSARICYRCFLRVRSGESARTRQIDTSR